MSVFIVCYFNRFLWPICVSLDQYLKPIMWQHIYINSSSGYETQKARGTAHHMMNIICTIGHCTVVVVLVVIVSGNRYLSQQVC